jgi:hypothetical protein
LIRSALAAATASSAARSNVIPSPWATDATMRPCVCGHLSGQTARHMMSACERAAGMAAS